MEEVFTQIGKVRIDFWHCFCRYRQLQTDIHPERQKKIKLNCSNCLTQSLIELSSGCDNRNYEISTIHSLINFIITLDVYR